MRALPNADVGLVTSGLRSGSTPALTRRLALLLALLGALLVGPAVAPAGAVVVKVGAVSAGVQPRSAEAGFGMPGAEPKKFANPSGHTVLISNRIYAIYWDPTGNYHGDWQHLIDGFLQNMGAASGSLGAVFAVDTQYTDKANQHANYRSTFMGSLTDTEKYPTSGNCADPNPFAEVDQIEVEEKHTVVCLTDLQVRAQLQSFIAQHSLPKGMGTVYYVLTPPGVSVCLDGGGPTGHCSDYEAFAKSYEHSFCSYHSDISPTNPSEGDANTILYGMIPWTAGGLGDGHLLFVKDRSAAFDCQDGGYNPSGEPPEQLEKKKERTEKEKEEFPKKTTEEKVKQEEEEALEGPHQQEPNQAPGLGPDGSYDTGLADLIISQIGVEQQNIVTNPLLDAWQDKQTVAGEEVGYEVTDECRNWFFGALGGSVTANKNTVAGTLSNQTLNGGNYYINDAFNLAAAKLPYPSIGCMSGIDLVPQFTVPNPVNSGELVGFNGMESDILLDAGTAYNAKGEPKPTYATYTWNFGDGSPTVSGYAPGQAPGNSPSQLCETPWLAPCAGSTFHSYVYGGTYEVTLTVTDVGGNTASVTHPLTVVGPLPPGSGGSGSGAGAGSGAPGGSGGSAGLGGPSSSLPRPIATAAAVSSSLKRVARNGLVVRYTVNEQVAGRFEVLLEATAAHQLGIAGPVATSLPAGSPTSLVIGHALLVTTKAGHSSVRIKFSKSVAKHLRRARKVKLTLRLTARNASSQSPLFTTVMSTVVLHH
jgi:hypothetical protein